MPPVAVRAVPAVASDVPLEISAIGSAEAIATVDVKARITAPVLRVAFAEAQDVQKGQLLFELDGETYQRQIAETQANIAKDLANENQAEANITKDRATLKNAQALADRGGKLFSAGIYSQEQSDQIASNADSAKAALEADRAALESAKAAAEADRARLEQTRLLLSYTKIYAPISGRVGSIMTKQGNLAKENDTTLVTINQTAPVYVSFSVPEDLLPEVRRYNASHPLTVSAVSSDGHSVTGTLRFIDSAVDLTTGTIKLKAVFDNAQRVLWPGQFVNVKATLSVERGRVIIPSRTVQNGPQGRYVWVVNASDSTVQMRSVQVLRNYSPRGQAEQAVIGTGLTAGDRVISEGQMQLAPGARVRFLQPLSNPTS